MNNWTGRIPKSRASSAYISPDLILDENDQDEIWGQLSYAVPAEKIKDFLISDIEANKFNEKTENIIRDMLAR